MMTEHQIAELKTYATAAIAGVVANPNSGCNTPQDLAHYAFDIATAMMREAERRIFRSENKL